MFRNLVLEEIKRDIIELVTVEQARFYRIIPYGLVDDVLLLYISNLSLKSQHDEIELILNFKIKFSIISEVELDELLAKYYLVKKNEFNAGNNLSFGTNNFLDEILNEAFILNCSDIHIETFETNCRLRLRIDGQLIERYKLRKEDYPALINKLKILSSLDISERRLPQDGRINYSTEFAKFDIRISVLPTMFGEKVVLRLLRNDLENIDISSLGFNEVEYIKLKENLKKTQGLILISGPTGSGKTTTLYSSLKSINNKSKNILTIEDPIEYTIDGINQVQLKESIGLNFASALRTFLRQDPDIIMVGEIRDKETAVMAVRAAMTGHLVLSTIHTNSAWNTVSRLIDMGIPSFLLANTLNVTIAQRLIRLLCNECKRQEVFTGDLFPSAFKSYRSLKKHFVPVGCNKCHYTGYNGRKAIYEFLVIDKYLSESIKNRSENIDEYLKLNNIETLSEKAFKEIEQGNTSVDEVFSLLIN